MNLRLTVHQMVNIQGELFKVVIRHRGELLLGRVVGTGYLGGGLGTGTFRLYRDYAQLSSGDDVPKNKDLTIEEGQFVVVQRVRQENQGEPSTYERILQLNANIQAVKDDYRDYGIIVRNLPDMLTKLKTALETYHEEHQIANTEIVQDYLDSHIQECRNCPTSFGKDVDEDKTYKITTIRQAKFYANAAVQVALSEYAPPNQLDSGIRGH